MNILSIDPGYGRCGVAILAGSRGMPMLEYSACIETAPEIEFGKRLLRVGEELHRLIKAHRIDMIAIEKLFFSGNQKTAMRVAEVRGMIIYLAAANDISLVEINPLSVKVAVAGHGRATKQQVTKMVEKLVRPSKEGMLDDEYDAIAVGITALAEYSGKKSLNNNS